MSNEPQNNVWQKRRDTMELKAKLEEHINKNEYNQALNLLEANPDLVNTKLALNKNINKHSDNNTPLKVFAAAGHLEGVKKLLALGAKIRSAPTNIKFNAISTLISVLFANQALLKDDESKIKYGDIFAELIKNDPTLIQPHEFSDIQQLGLIQSKMLQEELGMAYALNIARNQYHKAIEQARKGMAGFGDPMKAPAVEALRKELRQVQAKFYKALSDSNPDIAAEAKKSLNFLSKTAILEMYINNKKYDEALNMLEKYPELIQEKLVLTTDINNHPNNNTPLNVFIAAGHVNGVQELLKLGAMPKKEHEGRSMGHVYEDPYDALSTMLDVLDKRSSLSDADKKNYGDIAAELFKKDPELLEGRAYINLNVAYDPHHKINMINRIESIGLTDNDELRKIISPLKYSEEVKKIDDAIKILDKEDPHQKDAGKQAKKTALTTVKTAMKTGEDISGKIAAAKNDPKVMQGIWKGGLGRSRTENLLNELEDSVKNKEHHLPSTSFRMG